MQQLELYILTAFIVAVTLSGKTIIIKAGVDGNNGSKVTFESANRNGILRK